RFSRDWSSDVCSSDLWNTEDKDEFIDESYGDEEESYGYGYRSSRRNNNPGLHSYRNMQNTLGSFYEEDNSEAIELRKQVDDLKRSEERRVGKECRSRR